MNHEIDEENNRSSTASGPCEIADGVFEVRRRMLWLPFATALFLAKPGPIVAQQTTPTANSRWGAFLQECLPIAGELHKDTSSAGQEKYLRWLAYAATGLDIKDIPSAKLGKFKNLDPASYFGVGYRGKPFFVVEWRMEPFAYLPPHNHPNVSVCTLALEGEARIRNFEPLGDVPAFSSKNAFLVRETHNEILRPGQLNSLSAVRDNIHTFRAGKAGARGIDITTYHGENIGFSDLEINDRPLNATERTFEAFWRKL